MTYFLPTTATRPTASNKVSPPPDGTVYEYSYGYDGASRLTSADNPLGEDESYAYDEVGNRTSAGNAEGEIVHNRNNELERYGELEYEYDANGNMTEIILSGQVVFVYHYNADNRLIKVEGGNNNTIAEYYYDPFGRRLWKDANQTRTYFFYSDEGLIAEYDVSGSEVRSYGYQPDSTWTTDPLFLKQAGSYYFYQNDHLGTPQKLVAQNGAVVWSAQYAAFGKAVIEVETITNNLRFPGQYFDAETGLHYNWHRYYDPAIGRYLRTDPIGFEGSDVNWYRYAQENPIRMIDPFGLTDYNEIEGDKEGPEGDNLIYSCNCGWIDWTHADPGILNQMWNNSWALAEYQKNMFAPLEQFSVGPHGELILHKFGILAGSPVFTPDQQEIRLTVDLSMSQELKYKGIGLPYTAIAPYRYEYEILPECLDLWLFEDSAPDLGSTDFSEWQPSADVLNSAYQRQASIALGLWMHLQENFERNFQGSWWPPYRLIPGVGSSSFSEEDLPSDWIAFYMNLYKYDRKDITSPEICDAVSKKESQKIYRQLYGRDFPLWTRHPGTNEVWKPMNHNDVAPSCCDSGEPYLEWPEELNTIQPSYYDCWQPLKETKKWLRLRGN